MSEYWIDISDLKRRGGKITCTWISEAYPPQSHTEDTEFIRVIDKSKHEKLVEQLQSENAKLKSQLWIATAQRNHLVKRVYGITNETVVEENISLLNKEIEEAV